MKTSVKSIPEGYRTVTPSLTLKNSLKAIEFYKKAFGAETMGVFSSLDGKSTMHAVIRIGDSMVMMGDEMPAQGCVSAETAGVSPVSFFIYVPDVDAFFGRAVAAGAEVVMPVDEAFWGDRCGMVKDPFGYSWMIATHTRDLTQEEIRENARAFFGGGNPCGK